MFNFAEATKEMSAVEILNYYRNLYYTEPQVTERGIIANAINDYITSDVQEVKHGEWKRTSPTTPKSYRRICSVCCGVAYMIGKKYSYCPYCGTKMDLEEKENG